MKQAIRRHPIVERAQQLMRRTLAFELPEINFSKDIKGTVVIDCGANVGDITSRFVRAGAKTVYAFEPNPLCFSILERRFRLSPNVICLNQGVMDRAASLTLVTPSPHDHFTDLEMTVSSSFVMNEKSQASQTVEVDCVDLSEFIFDLNSRIGLLKLDIEGAEIEVINGLLDSGAIDRVDMVAVETHDHISPELKQPTDKLRRRISDAGLNHKFRLDWP